LEAGAAPDSAQIEAELKGKALQIYWFLIRAGNPVGVREIQRSLGFSSPSVAHHHLEKLTRLRLISQDEHGRYFMVRHVDVGVLQAFTKLGSLILPRYTFYGVFFTSILLLYVYLFRETANVYAIAIGLFAAGFSWYEAQRVWKKKPY